MAELVRRDPSGTPRPPGPEMRWMARAIASVWIVTAVAVLAPGYREIGGGYLARLGLPWWLMPATCVGELGLGLRIWLDLPSRGLAALQLGAIGFFTAVLGWVEPGLLVHPFGVLTKNLPLAALIAVQLRVAERGWDPVAIGWLRSGMAAIWLTEGLLPKILFQQAWEREVVVRSGLVPCDPGVFLVGMGLAQIASGLVVLAAGDRWTRPVLVAQAIALVVLPVLVSLQDPGLWLHPFAPLVKNLPILVGTVILACRPWSRSA